MATDEEIDRFVVENRELIERMMAVQKDNVKRMAELNKEMAEETIKATSEAADIVRKRSEEFFQATYDTIANPVVQKHFMNASLEFLAGLSVIVGTAPVPDFVKTAASDIEKNAKQAACRKNKDCPAKAKQIETVEIAEEECAE